MISKFEVVESTAGHDIGRKYLVSQVLSEDYVLLIDGDRRKILNPKKKKIKHIKSLKMVESQLKNIFEDKSKINDGEIKKILKKY